MAEKGGAIKTTCELGKVVQRTDHRLSLILVKLTRAS